MAVYLGINSQCISQNNFDFELSVGMAAPNFSHENLTSSIIGEVESNSLNILSYLKVHYVMNDRDLFFVQLLYSKSGTMNYNVTNLIFPSDVNNGTESKNNSSFDMSYIGVGVGKGYTTKANVFIDLSFSYIRHLDNTFNDVFLADGIKHYPQIWESFVHQIS